MFQYRIRNGDFKSHTWYNGKDKSHVGVIIVCYFLHNFYNCADYTKHALLFTHIYTTAALDITVLFQYYYIDK